MCDKVMAIRKEVKQQKSKMEQLQDDYEKQAAKAKVRGFFLTFLLSCGQCNDLLNSPPVFCECCFLSHG